MSPPGEATVLGQILQSTRQDVGRRRSEVGVADLERHLSMAGPPGQTPGPATPFADALAGARIALIAEHKRRSPSAGLLREGASVIDVVGAYERGGAAALSILTEERHFDGSLDDLRQARGATRLPLLRKDFIVDPYQLYEAAVAGADAILLIVAALEAQELLELSEQARALGLESVVEVHDADELDRALAIDDAVIGINNRDLRDFSVDVRRTFGLLERIPAGRLVVSESGVHGRGQLEELEAAGVHAVLVGETLMRAADPEAACRALTNI